MTISLSDINQYCKTQYEHTKNLFALASLSDLQKLIYLRNKYTPDLLEYTYQLVPINPNLFKSKKAKAFFDFLIDKNFKIIGQMNFHNFSHSEIQHKVKAFNAISQIKEEA